MQFCRYLAAIFVLISPLCLHAQREKLSPEDLEIVQKTWPNAKKTSTGLRYVVLTEGKGVALKPGDLASVMYTGRLLDGTQFDKSAEPLSFRVGRNNVIEGWDQVLQLMRPGDKWLVIIPPELAYGITDWWEFGLYLPYAVQDRQFLSDSFKLRTLFVSPNAEQRNFFYGVNFEFSHEMPKFAQTRFGLEIRPIIGIRNADWEFIVNPIVDIGFGKNGEADFTPAARVAYKLDSDLFVGLEYYADLGEIGNFKPLVEQQHTLFAVTDFKLGVFGVNFGVGYGLTPASDRFVVKTIAAYAFPVPGSNSGASERATVSGPVNPMAHASARPFQP